VFVFRGFFNCVGFMIFVVVGEVYFSVEGWCLVDLVMRGRIISIGMWNF